MLVALGIGCALVAVSYFSHSLPPAEAAARRRRMYRMTGSLTPPVTLLDVPRHLKWEHLKASTVTPTTTSDDGKGPADGPDPVARAP